MDDPPKVLPTATVDARELALFRSLDVRNCGRVLVADLRDVLEHAGLSEDDPRLRRTMDAIAKEGSPDELSRERFCDVIRPDILLIEQALQGKVVIPDFPELCVEVGRIYESTSSNHEGEVASYIPQLSKVDPDLYGVGVCTVDGQRYSVGDVTEDFCVQSCCKPIT